MKTIQKWTALALCLALFCALLPQVSLTAHAETLSGSFDEITWSFDSDTGTLVFEGTGMIGHDDTREDLPWDAYVDADAVTSVEIREGITGVGYCAFEGCTNLTSVSLPESLLTIGCDAFACCTSLTELSLPANVTTIESYAFYSAALTELSIPASVTYIDEFAFIDCTALSAIHVAAENPSYADENGVLFETNYNELLKYPAAKADADYVIPDGVTVISSNAFDSAAFLKRVTIPDSVTVIYAAAFCDCTALESVSIPDSVTAIYGSAFQGCSALTSVTIPGSVTIIDAFTFYGCTALTDVTIPDSVTEIEYQAFYGCDALTDVTIPASVYDIGEQAFGYRWNEEFGCIECVAGFTIHGAYFSVAEDYANENGFNFVSIEGSSAYSGTCGAQGNNLSWSFDEETGLLTIEGSGEMGRTPWSRFADRITAISFPEGLTTIPDEAFCNCTALKEVVLPNSVTELGWEVFGGCTALTSAVLPEDLEDIGSYTFEGCTELTSVTLPKNLKYTGYGSFANCAALTELALPEGLEQINDYAFYGCSGLTNLSIPDSVREIDYCAFVYCSGLTSVTLPKSLQFLDDYAFAECTGLTAVTIPAAVELIGSAPFANCTALTSIEIASENETYCTVDGILYDKAQTILIEYPAGKADASFTVPDTVTGIKRMAFYGCQTLEQVSFPASVYSISNSAFEGCTALNSVELADGLRRIDYSAFAGCDLHDVTIPDSVTYIGNRAFGFNVNEQGYVQQVQDFTIRSGWGTAGQVYADSYGFNFVSTQEKIPFEDVCESDYYLAPVCWAFRNQITAGVDETHFGGDVVCTREQLVTFLWKAYGAPEPMATESSFSDVPSDEYYSKAVIWAEECEITAGMGDGTFGVGQACTRGQAVTFLYALFGYGHWTEESFDDVKPSDWSYDAVQWAAENGITAGVADRLFGAEQICTRAQIVTFLYKLMMYN